MQEGHVCLPHKSCKDQMAIFKDIFSGTFCCMKDSHKSIISYSPHHVFSGIAVFIYFSRLMLFAMNHSNSASHPYKDSACSILSVIEHKLAVMKHFSLFCKSKTKSNREDIEHRLQRIHLPCGCVCVLSICQMTSFESSGVLCLLWALCVTSV